jgi:glycosyltransferase involved in cell wall biosynthesis
MTLDTPRRRFLFAIRTYSPGEVGGGARSVQALAEGLASRGHDVHVVRLAPRGREAEFAREAREAGVTGPGKPTLHVLPMRNIYWPYDLAPRSAIRKAIWHLIDLYNPLARRDFRRLVEQVRPEVVNTSIIDGFSPSILRGAKARGARLVHTMRDYYLICKRSGMFRNDKNCEKLCASCRVAAALNRMSTGEVDLFLSNSAYVARIHRENGAFRPGQPCLVQWNANDQPVATAPKRPGERFIFGYIGRLAPSKGIDRMLAAAARIPEGAPPWELRIAGSGDAAYTKSLIDQYGALPNVRFMGWSAPEDLYGAVDVLICPSVYNEPLPRVIYEGYAYGLPVIASDIGGNPEVVPEGETGFLYPPEDAAALTARMGDFLTMEPARYTAMSLAALAFAGQFTARAVLDGYEHRIEDMLNDR